MTHTLTPEELNELVETIRREYYSFSQWYIPMTCEERLYYDQHPPSKEEIEKLVRERGAIRVSFHGIEEWRMPDRLVEKLRQTEEFKNFQQILH